MFKSSHRLNDPPKMVHRSTSRLAIGILILGVTAVLYRKNNRTKLQDI